MIEIFFMLKFKIINSAIVKIELFLSKEFLHFIVVSSVYNFIYLLDIMKPLLLHETFCLFTEVIIS